MKKGYEKAKQEEAFKELLKVIGANGGKMPYGAMDKLIKRYQGNGFKAVTRQNLYYRLKQRKGKTTTDNLVGKNLTVSGDTTAVLLDLSGETFNDSNTAKQLKKGDGIHSIIIC